MFFEANWENFGKIFEQILKKFTEKSGQNFLNVKMTIQLPPVYHRVGVWNCSIVIDRSNGERNYHNLHGV